MRPSLRLRADEAPAWSGFSHAASRPKRYEEAPRSQAPWIWSSHGRRSQHRLGRSRRVGPRSPSESSRGPVEFPKLSAPDAERQLDALGRLVAGGRRRIDVVQHWERRLGRFSGLTAMSLLV